MDLDRKRRLFLILREILDAADDDRARLIEQRCAGDAALAVELRDLLARQPGDVLDHAASDIAARFADADAGTGIEPHPDLAPGGWRILRLLGRGGMGSVWLAERDGDGYVQQGALKLIKRGMDSDAVLARFRRERQILSRLAHPNIARLLDGGVATDGRPFLVMEYVSGEPLDAWARRTSANIDACIGVFLQLTDAVAHAHQRLVVHRDIKPGNVLVDASDHPQLLDFGVAKLLADTDADPTATAARFISRAYAAPEQLAGGSVTTAVDVYLLGVLLFEFLTGARFAPRADGARASKWAAFARENAGRAGPAAVPARLLRGDAGILLARATDADPARRYPTVEAFADDLRHWRSGQPIRARADSAAYRMQRFAGRHRVAAAFALVAVAALLAGSGVALWQARHAAAEARLAYAAQAFLGSVFDASAPDTAAGARVTARELLDRGSERISTELADQPQLRARMLLTLGTLYRQLGQFEQASALLQEARQAMKSIDLADDARARVSIELAVVERERGRLDAAAPLFDEALAFAPPAELASHALAERALLREKQARFKEALIDAQAATRLDTARGDAGRGDRARDRQTEALMLVRLGRFDDADGVFQEAIASAGIAWGVDDTRTAQIHNDYAVMLVGKARAVEAERELRKALEVRRLRLGDAHPAIAESQQVLGSALRLQGRDEEAKAAFESALAIQRRSFGDRHAEVANTLNSIGLLAAVHHDWNTAERTLHEATTIFREIGQDATPAAATTANNWGNALMQLGRYDEAEPLMRDALARHRAAFGDSHPTVLSDSHGLAQLELRRGHPQEAEAHARRAATIADAVLGTGRDVATVHVTFAKALLAAGHCEEAIEQTRIAERLLEEAGARTDPRHSLALATRADALIALGRVDEAQALGASILHERNQRTPPDNAELAATHALLARIARAQGHDAERRRERATARTLLATLPAADPWLAQDVAAD